MSLDEGICNKITHISQFIKEEPSSNNNNGISENKMANLIIFENQHIECIDCDFLRPGIHGVEKVVLVRRHAQAVSTAISRNHIRRVLCAYVN